MFMRDSHRVGEYARTHPKINIGVILRIAARKSLDANQDRFLGGAAGIELLWHKHVWTVTNLKAQTQLNVFNEG